MARANARGYLPCMTRKLVIQASILVVTGIALIAAGIWLLADSSLLVRAVVVVCGVPSVLRGVFLFWTGRNAKKLPPPPKAG